jgi:hypothetical protein
VPVDSFVPNPEPGGALLHDAGRAGEGLDIVDRGRLLQIAALGRKGRPVARRAALALERFEQRRFLAADIGAGAELDPDVEIEPFAAADIGAEQPEAAAGLQDFLKRVPQIGILAPEIDQPVPRAERVAGDRHAVEHQIGNSDSSTRSLNVPGSPSSALQTT